MNNSKIKFLTESAILICLSTVLSFVTVFKMPLGGSVTLFSMLPVCLISISYGIKKGIFSAFVYSIIQLVLNVGELASFGINSTAFVGSLFFDYIFAYSALGFAGIFGKKSVKNICFGVVLAVFLRFFSHFVSGTLFFKAFCPDGWNYILYSLCYNGAYMLPEVIFTLLGTILILKTSFCKFFK